MATVLLSTMEHIVIEGIVIVAGNCLPDVGMQTAWKIQNYLGRMDIPIVLSRSRAFNPFPWEYRTDCIKQAQVGALQAYGPNAAWPPYPDGDRWLSDFLFSVDHEVTVICL